MAKKDLPEQSSDDASNDRSYRNGGTWEGQGADSGKLAPPREILSDRNGPSDSDDGGKKRPS